MSTSAKSVLAKSDDKPAAGHGAPDLMIEVTRGDMVESRHHITFAVVDAAGHVVRAAGTYDRPVYPRSAIKALQAIALVETGAAEAFSLEDAEIALASASHSGEPRHVETVGTWLEKLGLSERDLECGAHVPYHEATARAMLSRGENPNRLHNNCSGKHAGFLTLARHLGHPTKGYIRYEHPVQQRILGVLEVMSGLDLSHAPRGIDGCGIPTIGIPLGNMALAMARLADPKNQPDERQAACARILAACAAEPFMVAGSGRFCTRVMEIAGRKAMVKTGAEGVFCAALPELGLGVALKAEDGATRASEVAMGRLLVELEVLSAEEAAALGEFLSPQIFNRAGLKVGEIRVGQAHF